MKHQWNELDEDWLFCTQCSSPWPRHLAATPHDGCQGKKYDIDDQHLTYLKFICDMIVKAIVSNKESDDESE